MEAKEGLYQDFNNHARKLGQITRTAAAKALDLPYDEMQIDARKTIRGVGTGGLIAAILAGGLPAAALGGLMLWQQAKQQPHPPVVEKQVWRGKLGIGYSQDGELEVDLDGKPVRVNP